MIDYRVGDSRTVTATLPDNSVDLIATSPPFLALRSYLPAGHESKGDEIGSEPNPAAFLDTLLELTQEWGRVLAPHGSIAVELGDSYSGSGGSGGDYNAGGLRDGQAKVNGSASRNGNDLSHATKDRWAGSDNRPGWPRAKSLALIPQLYAVALAYGINPLTGQPSPAGRWLVRNVIVWHRPNPAVGALGDKCRPSTSYITVATRSARRWYDLTAVRTPTDVVRPGGLRQGTPHGTDERRALNGEVANMSGPNPAGAPPLDAWFDPYDATHDTWTLTTQPSSLAHYAMWPAKLAERLILMMCPSQVCRECGEPRRRIETHERTFSQGWTDCGHDNYRPGSVLDPFMGSGTTCCVAELHGRDSIGIDLDPRSGDLLPRRMDECKRALYGTQPEMAGQISLFDGDAA